jgi:N-acetylmuramoyl-L-alanine amidase
MTQQAVSSRAAARRISAILFAVRKAFFLAALFGLSVAFLQAARPSTGTSARTSAPAQPPAGVEQQSATPQQQQSATPPQPQPATPAQNPLAQAAPAPHPYSGPVIVLNPAHGGTDTGARGENGAVEKDVVLEYARVVKGALEAQGYRVVLTRNDDSNPSYDDRAATANSYRDAIFISIHLASTGTVGTAHASYYQFWTPFTPAAPASISAPGSAPKESSAAGLIPWEEAQRPYMDRSHRLADILQSELASRFSGSPGNSTGIAIRGLRSVEAPAVAVEISSVAVSDTSSLSAMAAPLASCVVRAIQEYRPMGSMVTP